MRLLGPMGLMAPWAHGAHDYALKNFRRHEEMLRCASELYEQVKQVNGHFISIFSNELLGDSVNKVVWKEFYSQFLRKFHV